MLDCVFLLLRTRLGVSTVTVIFILVCFLCITNKVESYWFCEYANVAKASNMANMWRVANKF